MVWEGKWQTGAVALSARAGALAASSAEDAGVMSALVRALEDPAAIDDLAIRLVAAEPGLAACVRRAGELRRLAHRELAAAVPADVAAATGAAVDQVLDRALEVAAAQLTGALEEAALLDPLTGLANRRALDVDLERALANAGRAGAAVGVVMVDLDGLKARNDTEGHAAGDAALRRLGHTLQSRLRRGDSAYRIGGDEFVLLLPGGAGAVDRIIERVRADGPPAFSWGAARFPDDGATPATLLHAADARLYAGRSARRVGIAAPVVATPVAAPVAEAIRARPARAWSWGRLVGVGLLIATVAVPGAAIALLASSGRPPPTQVLHPTSLPPAVQGAPPSTMPPRSGAQSPGGQRSQPGPAPLTLAAATGGRQPGPRQAGHPAPVPASPPLSPQSVPPPTVPPSSPSPSPTPPPAHHHRGDGPDPDHHRDGDHDRDDRNRPGADGGGVSAARVWVLSLIFGRFLA